MSQNAAASEPDKYSHLTSFLAGTLSGITKLFIGHPFDTIKIRLQTEGPNGRFRGPLHCLQSTVHKEGLRALYKGATPPLVGWVLMDSLMLGTMTNLKLLQSKDGTGGDLELYQHALAGFGAGLNVCIISTPIELVKSQLQLQYSNDVKLYSGPIDCVRQVVKRNGVLALWNGYAASLLFRSQFWILFGGFEYYKRVHNRNFILNESLVSFLAGGLAANSFWMFAFPLDVIKNRIMGQNMMLSSGEKITKMTILGVVKSVYRNDGIRGFYRGFLPAFLRSFPTNGGALLVFSETVKIVNGYIDA